MASTKSYLEYVLDLLSDLEGIAYRHGWITEEKMRELAKPMLKNQYGQYLLRVIEEKRAEVDSDTLRG